MPIRDSAGLEQADKVNLVLLRARRAVLLIFAATLFGLRSVIGLPVPLESYVIVAFWLAATYIAGPLLSATPESPGGSRVFFFILFETALALETVYLLGNMSWVGVLAMSFVPLVAGLSLTREKAYLVAATAGAGMLTIGLLEDAGWLRRMSLFPAPASSDPRFLAATGFAVLVIYLLMANLSWRFAEVTRVGIAQERQWRARLQEANRRLARHDREIAGRDQELVGEIARRAETLMQRNQELSVLNALSLAMGRSLDLEEILAEVVSSVSKIAGASRVEISLFEEADRNIASYTSGQAITQIVSGRKSAFLSEPFAKQVINMRKPLVADLDSKAVSMAREAHAFGEGNKLLLFPVISRGKVLGAMGVAPGSDTSFSTREIGLLEAVGNMLGAAVENSLLYSRIKRISDTDSLTGIYNHRYLRKRLIAEVRRGARYGHGLAVLMVDVDDFKAINDSYGHLIGDQVLRKVASAIVSASRATDIPGRYGGDEFLVILTETDSKAGLAVAKRILERISQVRVTVDSPEGENGIGASMGLASMPRYARNSTELLAAADACLYEAKAQGGNMVVVSGAQTSVRLTEAG